MLASGTVDEVVKNSHLFTYVISGPRLETVAEQLRGKDGVEQVAPFGTTLHVVGSDEKRLKATLAGIKKVEGMKVARGETSLEDVFIQFMGGSKDNMS
jgi:ABC-2 type transport system ATP-binding protein